MELRLDHDFLNQGFLDHDSKAPDGLFADASGVLEQPSEIIGRLQVEAYATPRDIDRSLDGIGAQNMGRAGLKVVHRQALDPIKAARAKRAELDRIEWVSSCQDNISIPAGMLSTSSTH